MCPPSRDEGVTDRSRFILEPDVKVPSVERSSVSCETSAAKPSLATSRAVKHTPFTAIESPSSISLVTSVAAMSIRAPLSRTWNEETEPSSSIMPVNIISKSERRTLRPVAFDRYQRSEARSKLEPGFLVQNVCLNKLLVRFCEINDPFDDSDDRRNEDERRSDAACH